MPLEHITKEEAEAFEIPKHSLQTILINKRILKKNAKHWLKSNGYKYNNYEGEGHYMRFQQENPIVNAYYYSKRINPYVIFVFQSY